MTVGPNWKRAALLGAFMLAAAGLAACGGGEGDAQARPAPAAEAPRAVRVARVETRPLEGGLSVSGVLVAREEAAVATEIAGYRIARVLADEGQYVQQGQTLAVLDPTLINADVSTQQAQVTRARASVAQAEAALQQSQVQAAQAAGEAARVAGLDGQGVLSQEAIDARRSAAASARAAVGSARAAVSAARADAAAARAQLSQIQTRRSRTSIAAPVAGRILERTARPGDIAGVGAPLFRIARGGLVELDAEVPEAQLARVRPGDVAQVSLPGGGTVTGNVRYIDPTIDPQTRLGRARIALPPREDLRLGGFATAALSGVGRPARVVPEAAVRFTAEGAAVYTVAADRRVRRIPVRTGERAGGMVELLDGPAEGVLVILGGSAFVLEGDQVRPQLVAAAAQPPAAAPTTAATGQGRPTQQQRGTTAAQASRAETRSPTRPDSQTGTAAATSAGAAR
ncbi:MAG: efflux RND transporter periplasmic adaptor subunit [Proteobacteria bacterium]|nr:efflux RND transporter periplasmic adaptor subunit [Pseudomonadota bacterium]